MQGRRGLRRAPPKQVGGYQQPEQKPYEGTPLQAAWVELRTFLKVQPQLALSAELSYKLQAAVALSTGLKCQRSEKHGFKM